MNPLTSFTTNLDRRAFLHTGLRGAVLTAIAAAVPRELLAATTSGAGSIRRYETPALPGTPATEWLFINGSFTWDQAMKLPMSRAITESYGTGWLLAPMFTPDDFRNAADITKRAMGDLRKRRGPFIGVFQIPGSPEPAQGFVNLDGSTPFVEWGKYDPNNGDRIHKPFLSDKIVDAIKGAANQVISYYAGKEVASAVKPVIDAVASELLKRGKDKEKPDDVVALWHEGDGRITAADVYVGSYYPALLSRRKQNGSGGGGGTTQGRMPSRPRVDGRRSLSTGARVSRRSRLTWSWTGGARSGQVQILGAGGNVVADVPSSGASYSLSRLRPGRYRLRLRNITAAIDPWLEIDFTVA